MKSEFQIKKSEIALYVGQSLGKYGFPEGHPFGQGRTGG